MLWQMIRVIIKPIINSFPQPEWVPFSPHNAYIGFITVLFKCLYVTSSFAFFDNPLLEQSSLRKWHEMYAQSPTLEMCIQTALYIHWNQWPIFLVGHSRFKTQDSINHGTSTHRRSLPLNLIRRSQGSPISLHKCTSSTSTSRSGERHVLCVQQH